MCIECVHFRKAVTSRQKSVSQTGLCHAEHFDTRRTGANEKMMGPEQEAVLHLQKQLTMFKPESVHGIIMYAAQQTLIRT